METFQIRTDLALEARESVNEEESKLRGVSVDEHYEEETDIRITKVTIDTKNAEKTLGKPMGVYVTMEAPAMVEPDDDYHREISEALAEELLKMMPGEAEELSVLIVGLGNREVTARSGTAGGGQSADHQTRGQSLRQSSLQLYPYESGQQY